jgi:hypothetical protein
MEQEEPMASRNRPRTLRELVNLLEDPEFVKASWAFYKHQYLEVTLGVGRSATEAFISEWGIGPPHPDLLKPPSHWRRFYATVNVRWGLIPVYPWTTKKEIESRTRGIHRVIGKLHEDFMEDRRVLIAKWLTEQVSSVTGQPPSLSEIALVVWGRKEGLTRPSKSRGIGKMSFEQERALMRRYKSEGKTNSEAERLIYQRARGTETPAAAMVRMKLRRLKKEQTVLQNHQIDPQGVDRLAYAVTMLLRELHPLAPSQKPEKVYERAVALGKLLTEL